MGILQLVYIFVAFHYAACGLASDDITSFDTDNLGIINGRKVSIMDAPFVVAIHQFDKETEYAVVGAGSIIHELFILTSASVIDGDTSSNRSILLGTENLNYNGVFLDVEKVLCHENYDENSLTNDICLLKLSSSVPFAWFVRVALPDKNFELKTGTLVNITGWGATQEFGTLGDDLHQVLVPILSQGRCNSAYEDFGDSQICAGTQNYDFCEGDNGGPMTYNGIQIGVISGGGECGSYPGVYTRVSSYLDWIESTIVNNL